MHELKTKELIALLEIHNKYKTDNSGKIHISPRLLTRNSNNYGKFKIVGVSDKKYKDHKLFIHAGNYRFRYATNEEINLYIKNH